MATDFNIFPNSYEGTSGQDISFSSWCMDENPTLGPPPLLPLNMEPSYPEINVSDPDNPLSDPVIWAFFNGPDDATDDPSMLGSPPSIPSGEGCSRGNLVHPMKGSEVSVPTSRQYTCICCQTLRDITHFNGINVKRLEIHGRFCIISHAILTKYELDSSVPSQENQLIDFSKTGMPSVKKFLVKYLESCGEQGYFLLEDPLSPFYEALLVGLLGSNGSDDFLLSSPSPDHTGDYMKKQQDKSKQPDNAGIRGCKKIPLAKQRERTRNLKMKELQDYFDLPMEDAAQKMNVCPTVIKKICRKSGVERWPHRKVHFSLAAQIHAENRISMMGCWYQQIKSIEGKMSKKLKKLDSSDFEEREHARADIDKYKQELAKIYQQYSK